MKYAFLRTGFSFRSNYVFIPVLSVDERVSLEASALAMPRWSPLRALRPCFVSKRFFHYMICKDRPFRLCGTPTMRHASMSSYSVIVKVSTST